MARDSRNKPPQGYEDVFGADVIKQTSSDIELASHYPINPERLRLFVDGTRQFVQYGSVSQYNHATDVHELSPAAGETVTIQTAERARYTVQSELLLTGAFAVNQSLSGNDRVRWGYFDSDDGWFLEKNGSHGADEFDVVVRRNNSELKRTTYTSKDIDVESFRRYSMRTAWYNASRQLYEISYPQDGEQKNEVLARDSYDAGRGPRVGNNHVRFEVTADASTSGLVMEVGSMSIDTLGANNEQFRGKAAYFNRTTANASAWDPLIAFQVRSDLSRVVNVQLRELSLLSFSSDTTVEAAMLAFDASNVSFSSGSWFTPQAWSQQNNALEVHDNVSSIVDSTGTSAAAPTDPGGHEIGFAVLTPTNQQFQKGSSSGGLDVKRNLASGDIAVVCAKASQTGDVGLTVNWEQDW